MGLSRRVAAADAVERVVGSRPRPVPGAEASSRPARAAAADLLASALLLLLAVALPAAAFEELPAFPGPAVQRLSSRETAAAPSKFEGLSLVQGLLPVAAEPKEYLPPAGSRLPYTAIRDNTEGPAAFRDVLPLIPRPGAGRGQILLLDVGAGRSDAAKRFVERSRPDCHVEALDPYNRTEAENAMARRAVEAAGGADVATSMSVLNVVQEEGSRREHLQLLKKALRPGGLAIMKVWAGLWPERGSGRPVADEARQTFQANAWASAFLPEVEAVFGKGSAYADNNLNLIVALRD